jgi:F0F1-type ATP synthase delta subunit
VFSATRWAAAYAAVCGQSGWSLADGLSFLQTVIPVLREKALLITGTEAARTVDRFIVAALEKTQAVSVAQAAHTTRALLFLLIKRHNLRHADALLRAIERLAEQEAGVLTVALEAAAQPAPAFLASLASALKARAGVGIVDVKFTVTERPALLAGYRLKRGSQVLDYSLEAQLAELGGRLGQR